MTVAFVVKRDSNNNVDAMENLGGGVREFNACVLAKRDNGFRRCGGRRRALLENLVLIESYLAALSHDNEGCTVGAMKRPNV